MDFMDPGGMWMFWISALIGFLFTIALLVLAILAIIWLVRQLTRQSGGGGGSADLVMRELELRYARGEIDRETFLKTRKDLQGRS